MLTRRGEKGAGRQSDSAAPRPNEPTGHHAAPRPSRGDHVSSSHSSPPPSPPAPFLSHVRRLTARPRTERAARPCPRPAPKGRLSPLRPQRPPPPSHQDSPGLRAAPRSGRSSARCVPASGLGTAVAPTPSSPVSAAAMTVRAPGCPRPRISFSARWRARNSAAHAPWPLAADVGWGGRAGRGWCLRGWKDGLWAGWERPAHGPWALGLRGGSSTPLLIKAAVEARGGP